MVISVFIDVPCVWKFRTEGSDLPGSRLYTEVCHSLLLLTELNLLSATHTLVLYGASLSVWGCSLDDGAGKLSAIAERVPRERQTWLRAQ